MGKAFQGQTPFAPEDKEAETKPGMGVQLSGKNEYIYQLEKSRLSYCACAGAENWNI